MLGVCREHQRHDGWHQGQPEESLVVRALRLTSVLVVAGSCADVGFTASCVVATRSCVHHADHLGNGLSKSSIVRIAPATERRCCFLGIKNFEQRDVTAITFVDW